MPVQWRSSVNTHPSPGRRAVARAALSFLFLAAVQVAMPARAADVATETRAIGPFKTVRLVGSADLVLKQSDTPSLSVEGDKDSLQYLKAENRGDELVLTYDRGSVSGGGWWHSDKKGPRFVLSAKTLERISTAGNGDITSESFTVPGDLEISVSGSSDVKFGSLAARKLLVRISGSGDVTLAGGVLEQNVRIAGSGDYRSASLQSASATISIGGSGDATLWARDNLSVKIAGSGDVKYYGKPNISKSIAGSGSVTGLGDKP
jgi:hypothetical protein